MRYIFLSLFVFALSHVKAQETSPGSNDSSRAGVSKIAVFAPLYLDSAFDANNEYRYAKNNFPKFINSGLEFFEGVQLALDSLNKEGVQLEVFVYDTRSAKESLQEQLAQAEINDVSLVIAHCTNNEVRTLSDFALRKNIPVINTTVPNEAGTTGNPYFVILNPTLRTQCEGIYRFIQTHYALEPAIVFRRKSNADNAIQHLFDEYSKVTMSVPLKLKYVELPDNFNESHLKKYLDSTRTTLCIAGSLDMMFGKNLAVNLASLSKTYPVVIMGMPTWDGIRDFSRPEFRGPEIIYSTPFYNPRTDKVSVSISNYFNNTMFARPSDMVFRGYEVTWKFCNLLMKYGDDLSSNINSKQFNVFNEYDIQPVLNKKSMTLDFFENKKLYFLKWKDGLINILTL